MTEEKISLYFKDARSDKEYHIQLVQQDGGWMVHYQNGKRGDTLTNGRKTETPVNYQSAKKAYDKTVKEKLSKGYSPGEAGTAYVGTSLQERISGVALQLLNSVAEGDVESLLCDPLWVLQEKSDGHRRAVKCDAGEIRGVNRKGLVTGLPQPVVDAFEALGRERIDGLTVDGELVGDVLVLFDVLQHRGMDLRELPYSERLKRLNALASDLGTLNAPGLYVTATAYSEADKRAQHARLKALGMEGAVFKRLDAPYVEGRPSSGGTQLKDKFTQMASVRVKKAHSTKRSVSMELLDDAGLWVTVGNCTVPANKDIPGAGSILEVEYLYAFPGGSLFQPQFKFTRDDIELSACTLSQLRYKAGSTEDDEG